MAENGQECVRGFAQGKKKKKAEPKKIVGAIECVFRAVSFLAAMIVRGDRCCVVTNAEFCVGFVVLLTFAGA